jgi:uncharacterized protein (DUF1800 family)
VLELFGLGIGNYTERDVQEAARAFSGWGVDGRAFVSRERYHDDGPKEVFGERGRFDGHDLVDLILAHPACPRHVARRLLAEFAHPEPDEAQVDEWAAVLVQEDWNVERTLERLLRSQLFAASRRSRIAGPVELVAMTAVTLGVAVTPRDAAQAAAEMGQSLYRPPSVKGWDGGRAWIHAGSWLARHNHLTALAAAHGGRVDLSESYGPLRAPEDVAAAALALLLPEGATPAVRSTLEQVARESADLDDALRHVTALVLTAPEYHLV